MTPSESKVSLLVRDVLPQELLVRIRGADVLELEEHAAKNAEAPFPDLVERFVEAVHLGLFGGAEVVPWSGRGELLAKAFDVDAREQRWTVRLDAIDRGAFRVLYNLLRARDLDEIAMITEAPPGSKATAPTLLDVARLPYPNVYGKPPFEVRMAPALKAHKDRGIQIVFQRPPPDAEVDRLIETLEHWADLILLGGYAEAEMDPKESGCIPEPPFQLDELTVEAGFPEAFVADEAAFFAIINHAALLHRGGHVISAVAIR